MDSTAPVLIIATPIPPFAITVSHNMSLRPVWVHLDCISHSVSSSMASKYVSLRRTKSSMLEPVALVYSYVFLVFKCFICGLTNTIVHHQPRTYELMGLLSVVDDVLRNSSQIPSMKSYAPGPAKEVKVLKTWNFVDVVGPTPSSPYVCM